MTNLRAFDQQVRAVLTLKQSSDFESVKKFIVPYLYKGNLFKQTRDEYRKELEESFDSEEIDAILEDERPEIIETKWEGFGLTFLLDWGVVFDKIEGIDYLPKRLVPPEMSMKELTDIAVANLSKRNFRNEKFFEWKHSNRYIDVFTVNYSRRTVPQYDASILMDRNGLKRMYYFLGCNYVLFPLYRDVVYIVRSRDVDAVGKERVMELIKKESGYFHEILTEKVFEYDKDLELYEI